MKTKSSILIVDDDPQIIKALSDIVRAKGYTPLAATNGRTSIEIANLEKPAVALIDLKLDDISGVEVLKMIKKSSPATECIVLTGYASQDSAIKAVNLGAYSYVQKPYDMDHLLLTVYRAIEKQEVQKALQKSEERYRGIVENLPVLICRFLPLGNEITFANAAYCSYFGKTREEIIGQSLLDLIPEEEHDIVINVVQSLTAESPLATCEHSFHTCQGDRWHRLTFQALLNGRNDIVEYQSLIEDITSRKEEEEKFRFLSFRDSLTGLYNRAYFQEEMKRLNTVRKFPVGIIMIDVDNLKIVNDTMGHDKGDELLIRLSRILTSAFRKEDAVARIGGDEFAVVFPNGNEQTIQAICKRIKKLCARENVDSNPKLSVSLGYEIQYGQYNDMQEALKAADKRMYKDKYLNRGREIDSLESFQAMLTERDPHTVSHGAELQELALAMGKAIGFSEMALKEIQLLALLHDLGKVGIPDSIIYKKEKLLPEEWEIIKKHCEIGYRISKNIPELSAIAEGILLHHERWDGTGYPRGLKGKDIPVSARIMAIVDAFTVVQSPHFYNKPRSRKYALQEIRKGIGTQFDPELVQAFINIAGG